MATAIIDSGDRTQFDSGAVRDMHEGKGRFDLLPMCVLMRLARHYENGSKKYGDRNWEKGIPCHSFADSAMRHLVKYMDGWTDEDHLIAAIWNLCGLAWTEEKHPELLDIPARKECECNGVNEPAPPKSTCENCANRGMPLHSNNLDWYRCNRDADWYLADHCCEYWERDGERVDGKGE